MIERDRRGVVLFAVLIVVVLASLIGGTMLSAVDAERSASRVSLARTQSRALAWSGVQLAMAEIAGQRESMLMSGEAQVSSEWVVYEDDRGRRAVVRVVPDQEGQILRSETAKLDLNHASVEMLAKLPGIDTDARAQRVVDARPFTSVEELVHVEGFSADLLYGLNGSGDALAIAGDDGRSEDAAQPLIDLVTVFSFDPNVQVGLESEDKRGKLRVNLNLPWSDRLARAIAEQWGEELVPVAKDLFESGADFKTDQAMINTLTRAGVGVEALRNVLDAVTTSDDMYRLGRVDVMRAPEAVLACLPGLDADRAAAIVAQRESLDERARLSPMWLVDQGIVTLEEFAPLSDHVTMRSMVWRLRIESGFVESSQIRDVAGVADSVLEGLADREAADELLLDRVVYDVVIDASSERPRVAYLRDVTMLDFAVQLRTRDLEEAAAIGEDAIDPTLEADLLAASEADAAEAEPDSAIERGRAERRAAREQRRSERRTFREPESERADPEPQEPEPVDAAPEDEDAEEAAPTTPIDRRIGRWRSGGPR